MIKNKRPQTRLTYDAQMYIVDYAMHNELELVDALADHQHDFDDLVYENSETKEWTGAKPRKLNEYSCYANGIPFVSFFTGCGGMDIGFEVAGFEHIAAFEHNELFCRTLRKNRPDWRVFGPPLNSGDVSSIDEIQSILSPLITSPFEGIFIGGPPCQPFSIAANQRFAKSGENYKRIGFESEKNGGLLFDYIRLIEHFKPKCFVIENVPGLRDLDDGEQLAFAIKKLERLGYFIGKPLIINAADYGVAQFRERLFIIGSKNRRTFILPSTVDEFIGCGSVLIRDRGECHNNETRAHKLASILRYIKLNYGQRDQLGRVDRLDPCLPAKTVIAGGLNGGGRSHLHPEIPRTLTVRECARLQTFPDDYVFVGPTARQFTQVGNAVPPVLAAQISSAIAQSIFNAKSSGALS